MRVDTERKMKRWREQRWVLDQVIRANGVEWDQGRLSKILRNCGPGVKSDLQEIRRRVQKFADIGREFARAAQRREELARAAEKDGHEVEAREQYFAAATFYGSAQWPIYEDDNSQRIAWGEKKKACYDRFIQFAPRPIERVELPFGETTLDALLHFPRPAQPGERFPCVLSIPGMDGIKEDTPLYTDPFLERGMALLSLDGPGQGESRARGVKVTGENYGAAGKAACDYLTRRSEIDAERLAVFGSSMGSYWGTQVAAVEPRYKACAVSGVCVEPGQYTIFNMASPTFKLNFMYMAGYDDEASFDEFAKSLTLKGVAAQITKPYFVSAGEDDELCPVQFVYDLMVEVKASKVLLVYEGEKHGIRNPSARTRIINWLKDRLEGRPFRAEKVYIELSGREIHSDW
jgi:dipeptidyl aminopeptidase/acylaminoacyl peptidase